MFQQISTMASSILSDYFFLHWSYYSKSSYSFVCEQSAEVIWMKIDYDIKSWSLWLSQISLHKVSVLFQHWMGYTQMQ